MMFELLKTRAASITLLLAGLLIALGVLMARYEDALYLNQQIQDVDEQAKILAASVTAAVSFDDVSAAREYVDAVSVNPQVQAVGVYDAKGALFARFVRVGRLPARAPVIGTRLAGGMIVASEPVSLKGETVGSVTLQATAEPAQRRLLRYLSIIFLVTMGALVIAVLGFSRAALSKRAKQLAAINARLQAEMLERQKTEEVLRQSQKMEAIGQLSGGIAHDFNNLIMIVKGNLRLLRKRLDRPTDSVESYISGAETALDRAASLTQRILAFSRRQPLSPKPVKLSELVSGMMDLIHHSAGENVTISAQLGSQWWVLCDANQMENVILNLAINARDAMPEGGTIEISTNDIRLDNSPEGAADFQPGTYVALVIRDTGVGMSEDVRRKAFDPFFTTKPVGKGTGLGLSMTFGYVRQSNGHLVIDSELGRGTAITIYMPAKSETGT